MNVAVSDYDNSSNSNNNNNDCKNNSSDTILVVETVTTTATYDNHQIKKTNLCHSVSLLISDIINDPVK